MKIAVASVGPESDSAVEERFGRTPYILIYDTSAETYETIDNTGNAGVAHGAGTGTSQAIISKKVDVVVAGRFGPKAEGVLNAAGLKMVAWSKGTVEQAVEMAAKQSVG